MLRFSHEPLGDAELPPRARRIHTTATPPPHLGTTSACAENTFNMVQALVLFRNYLRVRGEYARNMPYLKR
ncbi:hypothetical protein HMPREF0299_5847 [Corynebacterium matruchotii ATCC 14266]|uniref:Uncharacterized protein n=1 Tax=Corynebacterium matruchotii ATCC 14266 TaxID=553207 RepID=E0DC02_9CORY|nr:hypothetical protein HMPREF0299_5847 [Corynebacterium matruchotii ATCC 14266]